MKYPIPEIAWIQAEHPKAYSIITRMIDEYGPDNAQKLSQSKMVDALVKDTTMHPDQIMDNIYKVAIFNHIERLPK